MGRSQQEEIMKLIRKRRTRLNPTVTLDTVRQFEAQYQITLPQEYVWFITAVGNGYDASRVVPGTLRLLYPLEHSASDRLSRPFPLEDSWFFHTDQCRHPESEPQYSYNISSDPDGLWERAQNGYLTLTTEKKRNLPLEQAVLLVVNGAARGQIWTLNYNSCQGLGSCNRLGTTTFFDWLEGHLIGFMT